MNKRQRKKQFKKIHGYNPYKIVYPVSLPMALKNAIDELTKVITKFTEAFKKGMENIKEMPEEEFLDRLNNSDLSADQIAAAKLIRYGRRNKDGD